MGRLSHKTRDIGATMMGLSSTLILSVTCIDFDNFDTGSVNQWLKLGAILIPAIGGYFSKIKGKNLNDEVS